MTGSAGDHEPAKPQPICSRCGKVMGVYEPLVCLVAGRLLRSSRAADSDLINRAQACYHAACFERRIVSAVDAA